jgi:3-(3-hydroxy-phenyl)propionate hydroxylase
VGLIEDSENALHFWFQKAGVDWVLIRPDRYVAALGIRAQLHAVMSQFTGRFAATASSPTAAAVAVDPAPAPAVASQALAGAAQ